MAAINDKTAYPQDADVADGDFIIGTDGTLNETRTFTLGSIGDHLLSNQNNSDDEPARFRFWSGTLVEYNALTPAADTFYNITDDSTLPGVVSFNEITGTPTTVSGYGITDVADVPSNDVVNLNGSTDLRLWAGTQAQFDATTEITDGSVVYIIRS